MSTLRATEFMISVLGAFMMMSRTKELGRGPVAGQELAKALSSSLEGRSAEEQQIGDLSSKPNRPSFKKPFDQVVDIIALIEQRAFAGLAVRGFGLDFADLGQACEHAVAVLITETAVDFELGIELLVNHTLLGAVGGSARISGVIAE